MQNECPFHTASQDNSPRGPKHRLLVPQESSLGENSRLADGHHEGPIFQLRFKYVQRVRKVVRHKARSETKKINFYMQIFLHFVLKMKLSNIEFNSHILCDVTDFDKF